jgi:hypothetical protein
MFCNSCSSNKVAKAALAPDKSRRYRVCDGCFSQLLKVVDSGKVKSELNTSKGAEIIRSYTPKLSRIFRDVNLPVEKEKVALVQRSNQRNEVLYTPVQAKSQRWGQVECPAQFLSAEDSSHYQSISKNHMYSASISERMHDPTVLKSGRSLQQPNDDQRKDLNSIEETLLTEEVKQLRAQVTL